MSGKDDTPVGDGVNALSSPLLLPKNKKAITGESSVRAVGPRASSFAKGFGGLAKRILSLVHPSFSEDGSAPRVKHRYASSPSAQVYGGQVAFIQDAHSRKDIMKAQGIPDFQAPPPIPKLMDTSHAIDELPEYDSFEPAPDDF